MAPLTATPPVVTVPVKLPVATPNAVDMPAPMSMPAPNARPPVVKQDPDFNPTIAKGDYSDYDVELESGQDFSGEVTGTGLVNVYLLDEDNLDNLDQGEEFWSETGEESVENATLEFTAPSKGKWYFVVENVDDRAVSVTVKLQTVPASIAPTQ